MVKLAQVTISMLSFIGLNNLCYQLGRSKAHIATISLRLFTPFSLPALMPACARRSDHFPKNDAEIAGYFLISFLGRKIQEKSPEKPIPSEKEPCICRRSEKVHKKREKMGTV